MYILCITKFFAICSWCFGAGNFLFIKIFDITHCTTYTTCISMCRELMMLSLCFLPKLTKSIFSPEQKVKLITPRITTDGYKIGERGFVNYILLADDIVLKNKKGHAGISQNISQGQPKNKCNSHIIGCNGIEEIKP